MLLLLAIALILGANGVTIPPLAYIAIILHYVVGCCVRWFDNEKGG